MLEFIFNQIIQVFWVVIYQLCVKFVVQNVLNVIVFIEVYLGWQVYVVMFGQNFVIMWVYVVYQNWGVLKWMMYCVGQDVMVIWNMVFFWYFFWFQQDVNWCNFMLVDFYMKYNIVFCIVVMCMNIIVVNWNIGFFYVQYYFEVVMYLVWYNVVIYQFQQMFVNMGVFYFLGVWVFVVLIKFWCVGFWNVDVQVMFKCQVELMVMLVWCIDVYIVVIVVVLMVVIVQCVQFVYNYVQVWNLVQYVVVFQENVMWIVFMNYMNYFYKQIVCFVVEIVIFVIGVKIGVWLVCGNNIDVVMVFGCIEFFNVIVYWFVMCCQKFCCIFFIFNECYWFNVIMQVVGNVIYICEQFQCFYGFFEFIVIVVQILIYLLFISYVSYIMMMMMMRIFYG